MDVSQQRHKVSHIVHRFALKTVLEHVARARVLLIIVHGIHHSQMLDGAAYILLVHAQQQVYVVRHQTVGIKRAERRQAVALVIILLQHQLHASEHTHIVLPVPDSFLACRGIYHLMTFIPYRIL